MPDQHVIITENLLAELENYLQTIHYDKLFVLTDTHTQEHCLPLIVEAGPIRQARSIVIQAGDTHKSLEQVSYIWNILSHEGASRNSLLINLGGGMVTDLGGFAGATFKRGLLTINIPTTLMASVDAAVGGKTGINFNGLKNEIGSFYPPACVLIDCRFLQTLDRNNILSGYAEMIKHALISNEAHYNDILSFDLGTELSPLTSHLSPLVSVSVAIKERIVDQDPKEHGIRKALNFGHTVGHAVESLSFTRKQPLLHGHAVAIGMICELYLSHITCSFPKDKLRQVTHYIKEYYPTFFFDCNDYDTLYELMTHDKKNEGGIINFTLLSGIGQVGINRSIPKGQVFESFDFYRESFGI